MTTRDDCNTIKKRRRRRCDNKAHGEPAENASLNEQEGENKIEKENGMLAADFPDAFELRSGARADERGNGFEAMGSVGGRDGRGAFCFLRRERLSDL